MDSEQAWQEAQRRWGRLAFANDSLHPRTFYVGVVTELKWDIKGQGTSFEQAFKNAGNK